MIQKLFESWRGYLDEAELIEGRLQDVKKKYPHLEKYIDTLSQKDPSGKNKYLDWMAKQLNQYSKGISDESIDILVDTIADIVYKFDKNSQRMKEKDINRFKTLDDLENAVDKLGISSSKKRKKEKETAMEGSSIIYEDDDFFIVRPDTEEASCYYGRNTRWCISATQSSNYFKRYTQEGKTFYMARLENLSEEDDARKLAFVMDEDGEWEVTYNASDDPIGYGEVTYAFQRNLYKKNSNLTDEQLHNKALEIKNKLVEIMVSHAKENPAERVDISEQLEEIKQNYERASNGWIIIEYDGTDDDSSWYFYGYSGFDFDDLNWKKEVIDELKIEKIVSTALDNNNIYSEQILTDSWDTERRVFLNFRADYSYQDDVQNFDTFADTMLEYEKSMNDVRKQIVATFIDNGWVDGGEYGKIRQLIHSLEGSLWKNFDVDVSASEIEVLGQFEFQTGLKKKFNNIDANVKFTIKNVVNKGARSYFARVEKIIDKAVEIAKKQLTLPGFEPEKIESIKIPEHVGEIEYPYRGYNENNDVLKVYVKFKFELEQSPEEVALIHKLIQIMDRKFEVFRNEYIDFFRNVMFTKIGTKLKHIQ